MLDVKKISLLPPWHMIETHPAFYDLDSKTAVGQTARLYGAMKELQEVYIEWSNKANAVITDFINNVNADQEEFENSINKIMHDYISMIDEKIKMQDQKIEDNLNGAIEELLNELIKTGKIKNIITTYEYDSSKETLEFKMGGDN